MFFPEGAFGPTNNCVGIGDMLRRRGHRVVFVAEESFAGTLEAKGFEERLMRLSPPPAVPEQPGQFWKDFISDTAPVFRGDTRQQLAGFILPTWQALVDGARYVDDYTPSIGFNACKSASVRWVEPLVPANAAAPFHPNARGEAGVSTSVTAAARS